jgi:hypothetical protein
MRADRKLNDSMSRSTYGSATSMPCMPRRRAIFGCELANSLAASRM